MWGQGIKICTQIWHRGYMSHDIAHAQWRFALVRHFGVEYPKNGWRYTLGHNGAQQHISVKKLQFNHVLTATCIDLHIENSKNDKQVILATIISTKCQCAAECAVFLH